MYENKKSEFNAWSLFLPTLSLIFIFLKLTGDITWSWLWVMGPIWIPISFWVLFGLTYVLIKAIK